MFRIGCIFNKHKYVKPDREGARIAIVQCQHCKTEKVRIEWYDGVRQYYALDLLPHLMDMMKHDPKFENFLIHGKFSA